MFHYHSQQLHSSFQNGKGRTRVQTVSIRGKKGYKSVEIRNKAGRVTQRAKKPLRAKEIACIRKCQFIPGLFKECEKCLLVK